MLTDIIKCPEKPWQNSLVGSREKINALFYNGNFSDLTITFAGHDIEYKAHRLIMAVSSSIFEGMLFGPMANKSSQLELPVDNPEAFKILLGSCYEVEIEPSDIDVALEVYMLADKYFMEKLEKECAQHIGNLLNIENVNKVLEFATHYNFVSLKETCFKALKTKFQIDVINSTKILLVLQKDWCQELLKSDIKISNLVFQDSWRYPSEILCDDIVLEILSSNCCRNPGLRKFSGCVSAKVVNNICLAFNEILGDNSQLRLSFTNHQQAREVISVLYDKQFTQYLSVHLQCNMIPTDLLIHLPVKQLICPPDLFISDVDNHGIEWVVSAARSLMPDESLFDLIFFPKCKLTFSGLKLLIARLAEVNVEYFAILVCSPDLPSHKDDEIIEWANLNFPKVNASHAIQLFDRNDDI
ncbi:unnamed protein product, partial [Meganyctiphanes norvegica]